MIVLNNKGIINQIIIYSELVIHCSSIENESNLHLSEFVNKRSENNLYFDLDENDTGDDLREIQCNNLETFIIILKEFFKFEKETILEILSEVLYGKQIELTIYK